VNSLATTIETKNLTKSFGKIKALNELNLKDGGGVSGLVGPNGAGKTTTIHILMGFLKPDEGSATVFSLDSWKQSLEIRKKVGYLQENPRYPDTFTGLRFLEYIALLHEIPQPKQKAKEMMKQVGLADASQNAIKTYSAGMLQRLGLAQALIGEPELIILDEPTANLDPTGRIDLLNKIKTLHKDFQVKFLISTHILPELEKVCNWVSIIDKGSIVDQGYVKDLAVKYSSNTYRIETSNPQALLDSLKHQSFVDDVWLEENIIYARVKDTKSFREEVPRIVATKKMQLIELRPIHGNLEEIYTITMKEKNE